MHGGAAAGHDGGADLSIEDILDGYVSDAVRLQADIPNTHIGEAGSILEHIKATRQVVEANHAGWNPVFKLIAVAALVCRKKRMTYTNIHEHVELLHAVCGDVCLRAHNWGGPHPP